MKDQQIIFKTKLLKKIFECTRIALALNEQRRLISALTMLGKGKPRDFKRPHYCNVFPSQTAFSILK